MASRFGRGNDCSVGGCECQGLAAGSAKLGWLNQYLTDARRLGGHLRWHLGTGYLDKVQTGTGAALRAHDAEGNGGETAVVVRAVDGVWPASVAKQFKLSPWPAGRSVRARFRGASGGNGRRTHPPTGEGRCQKHRAGGMSRSRNSCGGTSAGGAWWPVSTGQLLPASCGARAKAMARILTPLVILPVGIRRRANPCMSAPCTQTHLPSTTPYPHVRGAVQHAIQ